MRDWSLCVDLSTIDLDHGRRPGELNLLEELDAERAAYQALPLPKKIWAILF
jgi:hypothetical protein